MTKLTTEETMGREAPGKLIGPTAGTARPQYVQHQERKSTHISLSLAFTFARGLCGLHGAFGSANCVLVKS